MKLVVIHWNGLWQGSAGTLGAYENSYLGPVQYEGRRPYYASRVGATVTANCNTQAVVDSDLTMASQGGLEAFMYLPYPSEPNWLVPGQGVEDAVFTAGMNGGYKLYQTSSKKNLLKHCVLGEGYRMWWNAGVAVGGGNWNEFAEAYVNKFFSATNYLKYNGRPVWGLLDAAAWITNIGGGSATLGANRLAYMRNYSLAQGYGLPYVVCLDGNATAAGQMQAVVQVFDAFSAYATAYANADNAEHSYATLTAIAEGKWTTLKNSGAQVIPQIATGWDYRPRMGSGSPYVGTETNPAAWITRPTVAQLIAHITNARTFISNFPGSCESDLALAYSWNEFTEEDGALCPNAGDNYGNVLRAIATLVGAPGLPLAQISTPYQSLLRAVA